MSNAADREEAFLQAYNSLNKPQKQAVDTIEGPVLVVAGPGTGKTQILTLRIANILRTTDTQPEQILALTFTESGAKAMQERLRTYVGALAYRVPIYTFHGFAGQLIAQYPDSYSKVIGGRPAGDIDIIRILESILDNPDFTALRPANSPHYYVPALRNMITTLKQEYVSVERLQEIVSEQEQTLAAMPELHEKGAHKGKVRSEYTKLEKNVAKNRELISVYTQYEALMREQKLYDFSDMLLETVTALESNEDMLRDVQETYHYVLADEHQDVNGTQNTLLEQLVSYHDSPNIFAVGDEKQAIYRFQGASLENFLYFEERFPNTTTIALTENYRSGQRILDAAHSLVAVENGPLKDLRVPLTAAAVSDSRIERRAFSHQAVEDDWLVTMVAETVKNGTPAEEVAVIVRTNAEVERIAALLRKRDIAVQASAEGDILSHPLTQHIEHVLQAIIEPENDQTLFALFQAPYWKVTPADKARVCAARSYDWPLARLMTDETELKRLGVVDIESVTNVMTVITAIQNHSLTRAPHQVLEQYMFMSGLLEYVTKADSIESSRVIRRLYDEIESLVVSKEAETIPALIEAFKTRRLYGIPLVAPYINTVTSAVSVMTAHKSKGLEYEVVFMPHLTDKQWGGATRRELISVPLERVATDEIFDNIDDERRLLYVGMTRAKHTLHVSSSSQNTSGSAVTPSRLLEEIDTTTYTTIETTEAEISFAPTDGLQALAPTLVDTHSLLEIFLERGFSATSLNNFLVSPWTFLYRNLLRIPEVQGPALQYGTVVHNVLEQITRHASETGELATTAKQKQWLERELGRLPLTTTEYTAMHERALHTLTRYQEHLGTVLPKQTTEEFKLSVVLETGIAACPHITLTGKLDRLDWSEDESLLRVVDYKTGKPRTRNAIEGKTASSDGGYKRQLVFYALLLELYGDERYLTRDMTLSFVEATTKDEIKEEHFTITDAEITELKDTIVAAVQSLVSGEAWQTPCDPVVSDYCNFLDQIK